MVQEPAASKVTVEPDTEHIDGVVLELKLTASPEVVEALTVNGAVP